MKNILVNFQQNNKDIEITHVHLNDHTVAGIRLKNKSVISEADNSQMTQARQM